MSGSVNWLPGVLVVAGVLALAPESAEAFARQISGVDRRSRLFTFITADGSVTSVLPLPGAKIDLPPNPDILALAAVVQSEAGGEAEIVKIAVAHATKNLAKGRRVWDFVRGTAGTLGSQGRGGRQVSSARAPTLQDWEIARAVLAGGVTDPTLGAIQFDSPQAQNTLLATGAPGYTRSADQVERARLAAGAKKVLLPGVPESTIRFWRYYT